MKKIFILLMSVVLFSCEKEEAQEGPDITDYYSDFQITEPLGVDSEIIDFSEKGLQFDAKFSVKTWWKLTITGLESGAVKTLGARTAELGVDGYWNGTADANFFQEEACLVELSFRDHDEVIIDTVEVTHTLDFNEVGTVLNTLNSTVGVNAFGALDFERISPAEGAQCAYMEGLETGNLWWLNGFGMPSINPYVLPSNDPDLTYFNVFVYGTGSGGTKIVVGFKEDEDGNKLHEVTEDSWEKSVLVDWEGWQLVSFPMSDTEETTDNGYGNGNKTRQLDRIVNVEIGLYSTNGQADPAIKAVAIDHPVFTIGPLSEQ